MSPVNAVLSTEMLPPNEPAPNTASLKVIISPGMNKVPATVGATISITPADIVIANVAPVPLPSVV